MLSLTSFPHKVMRIWTWPESTRVISRFFNSFCVCFETTDVNSSADRTMPRTSAKMFCNRIINTHEGQPYRLAGQFLLILTTANYNHNSGWNSGRKNYGRGWFEKLGRGFRTKSTVSFLLIQFTDSNEVEIDSWKVGLFLTRPHLSFVVKRHLVFVVDGWVTLVSCLQCRFRNVINLETHNEDKQWNTRSN